jgi:hypothetical protein
MEPIYFATPAEFRAWLEANHDTETELLVGPQEGERRPEHDVARGR